MTNAAPGSSTRTTESRLRGLVSGIMGRSLTRVTFSRDDTLAEIGLASMDMISLMLAVESEFDIAIPQEEITAESFRSVSTIEELVERLSGEVRMSA